MEKISSYRARARRRQARLVQEQEEEEMLLVFLPIRVVIICRDRQCYPGGQARGRGPEALWDRRDGQVLVPQEEVRTVWQLKMVGAGRARNPNS